MKPIRYHKRNGPDGTEYVAMVGDIGVEIIPEIDDLGIVEEGRITFCVCVDVCHPDCIRSVQMHQAGIASLDAARKRARRLVEAIAKYCGIELA